MYVKDINPISLSSHGLGHCIVDIMALRSLVSPTRTAQERAISLLRVSVLDAPAAMLATVYQAGLFCLLISLFVLSVPVLRDDDDEDDVHQEEGTQEDEQYEVDRGQDWRTRVHHLKGVVHYEVCGLPCT